MKLPSALIIELKKLLSSIGPSTIPRIAGATGKPFSSIRKPSTPKVSITDTANALLVIENAPTIQNIRMTGMRMVRGTRSIGTAALMASQPNGTMMMLAMKKTMKIAVTSSACC